MTFKIQGQSHSSKSHNRYNILLTIIPSVLCWSALHYLRYSYLKNWPWKSKFKVMGEVKVKSHNVSLTSYRLTSLSFHVNQPSHSWDTAISEFDVENSRSRSWVRSKLKVTTWGLHSVDSHPFRSMSLGHPIPELWLFENLTLKIQGQGRMTMMLHNYRSRQFHRTSNGINPSRGFSDMGSSKCGPSAAWFDKFLAHGQAHMGQMGK